MFLTWVIVSSNRYSIINGNDDVKVNNDVKVNKMNDDINDEWWSQSK